LSVVRLNFSVTCDDARKQLTTGNEQLKSFLTSERLPCPGFNHQSKGATGSGSDERSNFIACEVDGSRCASGCFKRGQQHPFMNATRHLLMSVEQAVERPQALLP
jgi:hypothetical protein